MADLEAMEIRICDGDEIKDEVCMHCGEMKAMPDLAFGVITQRAEQVLNGKVLKRITYLDDEDDPCTLSSATIEDAISFCRNGVLHLYVNYVDAVQEPPVQAQEAEVSPQDAVEVTHSRLKLQAAIFEEGVQAWSDRNYVYKNIPDELLGATLYRSEHIVPTNSFYSVQAPAGSVIYVFSETHRDGGFPGLGLEKCDAKRFRWEIPESSGKHYSLSLWKFVSTEEPTQILVCESLVGGIAVKSPCGPKANPAADGNAGKLLEKLAGYVGESNVFMILQKLGEKGLDLMAEHEQHFTDAWIGLIQPLHLAASGQFTDTKQVISFVQAALEVYKTLPTELQHAVVKSLKETVHKILMEKLAEQATQNEIHPCVVCDGCEQDPLSGKRFKCTVCRDFDLCETCYNKRDSLHPGGHAFKLVPGHRVALPVEVSVSCDGCGKKKIQPQDRFKCLECPDYDLCTSCFEARSFIHPQHSVWEHLEQRLCCGSAPPAEEPETNQEDKAADFPADSKQTKSEIVDLPACEADDAMMACPCTPDLLDEKADVANAMAVPCTPPMLSPTAMPYTPTTPDEIPGLVSFPSTPPEPKLAWVPQPCTPPLLGVEENMEAVSESEIDPKVAVVAMAKLLSNPNRALRQAVVQAMSVAEVEVASRTPKPDSGEESGSDISDDWERLESNGENEEVQMQDAAPLPSSKPQQLVKVVFVSILLGDPNTMQQIQDNQGVMEWRGAEAFRLGKLEIIHTGNVATTKALVKIVVVNIGETPWPEASSLQLRDGPSWGFDQMPLGPVNPGEIVELVLDLAFTPGHPGDTLTSAWAVTDGEGSPIGTPMVLEVVRT